MTAHNFTVTIVVENAERNGFAAEHGLAFWIETPYGNILMDTGQGDALLPNAKSMGIDLSLADYIVLSHGHFDHAGALDQVLSLNPTAKLVYHPEAMRTRYSIHKGKPVRNISMQPNVMAAVNSVSAGRKIVSQEGITFGATVGMTGEVPRENNYEDVGGPFFLDTDRKTPDSIPDDQSMWFKTEQGLVIVTGCAHSGVVNTVHHARRITGEHRIAGLIGGFHLNAASERRLKETSKALLDWNVQFVHPCHCTGHIATDYLKSVLGNRVTATGTGDILKF